MIAKPYIKKSLEAYRLHLKRNNKADTYYSYLKPLFDFFRYKSITNLARAEIEGYLESRNYKIESKNCVIKALKDFCKTFGIKNEVIENWELITPDRLIKNYPSADEIRNATANFSFKDKLIISLLLDTAIRKNELLTLRKENLDIKNKTAKVFGKGRKERLVYFTDKTAEGLKTLFDVTKEEGNNIFNIKKSKLRYLLFKLTKSLQKGKLTPHSLRKSGAVDIYKKFGNDIIATQRILGHKSLSTTQLYLGISDEEIKIKYQECMNGKD